MTCDELGRPNEMVHIDFGPEGKCMYFDLTSAAAQELADIHRHYVAARASKDYKQSDALRVELIRRGCIGPDYSRWHPNFESSESYAERQATGKGIWRK